jgi:hypothetical protein
MSAQYLQRSYFGGSSGDTVYGASYNLNGTLLAFVGNTFSSDFPTQNPIAGQTLINGDGFLLVLRKSGNSSFCVLNTKKDNQIIYSTVIGGSGLDWFFDIAEGPNGNFHFCGMTRSNNLIRRGKNRL